ncbi:exodeoxyribonuclease VII large subunit [Caldimonas tepidiphila]|uniref:exodeoxyribonuclease VII large subunit n=1 Tax=Caldimonas tepidiphila TaxID=2315841 RepID=UPI000E5B8B6B|nr:exodeoxyribonuclease VII large subunit [Caldimonas tepidiphila]
MSTLYLNALFKDKDAVKALGARWDPEARKWYVPPGLSPDPFADWLPDPARPTGPASRARIPEATHADARGIPLSQLMRGVAQAVAEAYRAGVWTRVEIVRVELRRGHVHLELAERRPGGELAAQARGMIWAGTASRILPEFEQATGAQLAAGLKLLVRARPEAHALYGLSLSIDAIDPQYTLGDLETRKREIRARLQREGLHDANRRLPHPWDYQSVLVIAPQGAAGLGDFRAEAQRLARHGVCRFVYAFSRFQGEGAAAEIRATMLQALQHWHTEAGAPPDAVVILRGGGAVNDLAWLNDYELARSLCELGVPVLTGIGHERDSTVLDEVANLRFDTPSKVILGIEQVIHKRAADARGFFADLMQAALHNAWTAREAVARIEREMRSGAREQLAAARRHADATNADIRLGATWSLHKARHGAHDILAQLRHETRYRLSSARHCTAARLSTVLERSRHGMRTAQQGADRNLAELAAAARRSVQDAASKAQTLMREIAGQGPEKTLRRGFAIVRTAKGQPITDAGRLRPGEEIEIQFRDGTVPGRTSHQENQR